jgi:hypothetical protein
VTTWIAEEPVVFVHPNGTRTAGRIALGAPVRREHDCACQVALDGMERSVAIYGDSTLQALLLASRYLGMRLHDFLSRGGRVLYPPDADEGDDTDVALSALFGSFLREPDPVPPRDDEA